MTYPDETMKAAREVVKKWTYEGCLDQHIAAAIQAAEVRGYDKAVEDAVSICLEKSDSDSRDVDVMMQAAAISDCADAILALKKGGE